MSTRNRFAAATLSLLTLALAGCGGLAVKGSVVSGPIGRALVVDARDERFAEPGMPGVEVKVVRPGTENSGGIAPLATAVTDGMGRFQMKISDRDKVRGPIVIITDSPDSFRTATRIYPPRAGQEVLVNVRARTTAGASGSTD